MRMKFILCCLCSVCYFYNVQSQDLHYSDYSFNQLYLNPANTGGFNGAIRAAASYRDQSRNFHGEPYQSLMAWADSPIAYGLNKQQWIGLGIYLLSDKTGDLGLAQNGMSISAAYHIGLDEKFDRVIGVGLQYGSVQKKINSPQRAQFGDDTQGMASLDHQLINDFNESYTDINFGVNFKQKLSSNRSIHVGASIYHLNGPKFTFRGSRVRNNVKQRINIYGIYNAEINDKLNFSPALYISRMGKASNIMLQAKAGYKLKEKTKNVIQVGLGYRLQDALVFSVGGVYKSWEFGLNYDMTISSAAQYNNTVGGLELGVMKYFNINKKPKVTPVLICPRQ